MRQENSYFGISGNCDNTEVFNSGYINVLEISLQNNRCYINLPEIAIFAAYE